MDRVLASQHILYKDVAAFAGRVTARVRARAILTREERRCVFLYFYDVDRDCGLMHVRLQTWLPQPVQVCVNGRTFAWEPWLTRSAAPINPWIGDLFRGYYWSVRESEFATDVIVATPTDLQAIYPRLLHHAIEHVTTGDLLRFLGRVVPGRFYGEAHSTLVHRPEGVRIRHWLDEPSIKMSDKGGRLDWLPLRRGIADMRRRALQPEVAADPGQRRYVAGRVTRWLRLLRAHGLIKTVTRTRDYRLTDKGHHVMTTALRFRETDRALLAA